MNDDEPAEYLISSKIAGVEFSIESYEEDLVQEITKANARFWVPDFVAKSK